VGGIGGSPNPNNVEINLNDPAIKDYLDRLASNTERNFYLTHPWFIFSAMKNSSLATSATDQYFGNNASLVDGCNANAFKHAYWSGLNTLTWDNNTAYTMGNMHETANDFEIQKSMDRHNNNLGVQIAQNIKNEISDPKDRVSYLKDYILDAIQVGQKGLRINNNVLIPTDWSGNSCQ
jgi:hypothetical protein